jgi:ATP-dependent helicase HrpB
MMGEAVGQTVGYRMRLERRVSDATRIEVVTEGVLTRLIQSDPGLTGIGLVIFDEFHERSIHADTGLALCLDAQEGFRPDLRLLVMSATLDTQAISGLLGNAPIVRGEGRQFPVETRYLSGAPPLNQISAVTETILRALREEPGNLLVFLPGIHEIRQAGDRLSRAALDPSLVIAPLHGGLPGSAQDLAIEPAPAGKRKIVLSTSIAETSLTIEGIRVVIDSGLKRVSEFDVGSGMARLVTLPVDRDTAAQRRGRAGRLEPGVCYRLWSEARHRSLPAHGNPEIRNTDLTPLALELAAWGVSSPDRLSWLDPPPPAAFARARDLLTELGALDERGFITEHGKRLSTLGLHPRLGHMISKGVALGLGALACELAALLGEKDILFFPPGERDTDLRLRVAALRSVGSRLQQGAPENGFARMTIDRAACRRAQQTADHLKSGMNCREAPGPTEACGLLLAFAYPDRIACRRPGDTLRYRLSNGRGACFADTDPLSAEEYLVAASVDGGGQEARIFLAAPVSFEALTGHFEDRISERSEIIWDSGKKAVKARRAICFGKVILKDFPIPGPDPALVGKALCEGIREEGIHILPWTKPLRAWQARVLLLRNLTGGNTWPDVSDEPLAASLEEWLLPFLPGIARADQLRHLNLSSALLAMLPWKAQQELDRLAPTHLTVPSGSRIPIDYTAGAVPVLAVRLQEMFGATETPRIAAGKLPLLLHLLSPAGRAVQVTRDLKSFWTQAYFEVKKDLMGRYPKHHWPENPFTARATNRTKR